MRTLPPTKLLKMPHPRVDRVGAVSSSSSSSSISNLLFRDVPMRLSMSIFETGAVDSGAELKSRVSSPSASYAPSSPHFLAFFPLGFVSTFRASSPLLVSQAR